MIKSGSRQAQTMAEMKKVKYGREENPAQVQNRAAEGEDVLLTMAHMPD